MLTRRYVFWAGASALAVFIANRIFGLGWVSQAAETFEVTHSDAEWSALLTPAQYGVLRQQGTERPFSSPLDHEKRPERSPARAATSPCFPRRPSTTARPVGRAFWQPLDNAVGTSDDTFSP